MRPSILVQFDKYPDERDLIGRIILAYGELEVMLMDLVRSAVGDDTNTAVRLLFRLRSEAQRLQVADALVRPLIIENKLLPFYEEAFSAVEHCKKIRNQYAHSQWVSDPDGELRFGNLEESAKTKSGTAGIRMRPITFATLKKQFAFFSYADHALLYVGDQLRLKLNLSRLIEEHVPRPKIEPRPKLDSRGDPRLRH